MYEGNLVELKMKKNILLEGEFDRNIYHCRIITYKEREEFLYMLLENGVLEDISLDAVYECSLSTKENLLSCDGMVKERYMNTEGKIIVFQIENGFYKINIK